MTDLPRLDHPRYPASNGKWLGIHWHAWVALLIAVPGSGALSFQAGRHVGPSLEAALVDHPVTAAVAGVVARTVDPGLREANTAESRGDAAALAARDSAMEQSIPPTAAPSPEATQFAADAATSGVSTFLPEPGPDSGQATGTVPGNRAIARSPATSLDATPGDTRTVGAGRVTADSTPSAGDGDTPTIDAADARQSETSGRVSPAMFVNTGAGFFGRSTPSTSPEATDGAARGTQSPTTAATGTGASAGDAAAGNGANGNIAARAQFDDGEPAPDGPEPGSDPVDLFETLSGGPPPPPPAG